MMKKILIPLLLFSSLWAFGNDRKTMDTLIWNSPFSIIGGINFETFLGSRYIEHPVNTSNSDKKSQYDGFTKVPAVGFQAGARIQIRIVDHLFFTTGTVFTFRKDIFEGNQDTVKKYGTQNSVHLILKYNYTYYDLDIPVLLTYRFHRWAFSGGINVPLITYSVAKYTYIPKTAEELTGKTVKDLKFFRSVFPVLQASYFFISKTLTFEPFAGFEYEGRSGISLQTGLILRLNKCITTKKSSK